MKGYDYFVAQPGEVNEMHCGVCGTLCIVYRNVYGPTSWASAMGKKYSHHDAFKCPHADEAWHEQALRLVEAIEETPSRRVADLMRQDLADLLGEHGIVPPGESNP